MSSDHPFSPRATKPARTLQKLLLPALLFMTLGACDSRTEERDRDDGVIHLALTAVPADVACVQLTVSDGLRTLVRKIDMPPGGSFTTTQPGLPTGGIAVAVDAFAAACAAVTPTAVPTWVSGVVQAHLIAGAPMMMTVNMTRPGIAIIGLVFAGDGGVMNVCGNGVLGGTEACDDGNPSSGDGCSATCNIEVGYQCPTPGAPCVLPAVCGNGQRTGSEACDDGNPVGGDGCSSSCTIEAGFVCPTPGLPCTPGSLCGNGQRTGSEMCDDGNRAIGDGCSASCSIETGYVCPVPGTLCTLCGNNVLNPPEQCDDGPNNNGGYGACTLTCTLGPRCGDGALNGPEQCDLGSANNTGAYGGCKATCTWAARCGDGARNGPESCDDGVNNGAYGGCLANCTLAAHCGDGIKNGPEQCDLGTAGNTGAYNGCTPSCSLAARCGDSAVNGPELCDAGPNNGLGTGGEICSTTCQPEYRRLFEAESGTLTSPMVKVTDSTARGGQAIAATSGSNSGTVAPTTGRATFSFVVSQAGTFKVWGRAKGPSSSDDSFWVSVDGQPFVKWNDIFVRLGSGWGWDAVRNSDAGNAVMTYSLAAGAHTVVFAYREDGASLDQVLVTNNLAYVPQ